MPLARPCAMPKRAPTAWASAWQTPTNALENARPGERRRVAHGRAGREVGAVGAGARERVEDQVQRLHAERVGVGRGEDRDAGLERVRERVDAGVGGQRGRHRQRQPRVDDRDVGHQRVVDERELAPAGGEHRGRRDLRAGAGGRRARRRAAASARPRGTARRACARRGTAASARAARARGLSWNSRIAFAASITEPPPTATIRSGRRLRTTSTPARTIASPGSGSTSANTRTGASRWRRTSSATPRASVSASVTISACSECSVRRRLERARVEVGVRRDAEPLRRRLAARDGLDVEQVAVVDVVGGQRAAPGPAAERERRRHRVVDAAERADRGRRVDEDAARCARAPRRPRSTSSSVA